MNKTALVLLLALGCTTVNVGDPNMYGDDAGDNPLAGQDQLNLGASKIVPPGQFDGYGPEVTLLQVDGDVLIRSFGASSLKSRNMNIHLAVYPVKDPATNQWENTGPLVGRLLTGAGSGQTEFEFDIQPAKPFAFDPVTGNANNVGGTAGKRYGLTVVSLACSAFTLYVRNDANLRTYLPVSLGVKLAGDPSGPVNGAGTAADPFRGAEVFAWVSLEDRPAKSMVTKSIVFSRIGANSAHAVGVANGFTIPIPTGAKRVRIYRTDAGNFSPSYQVWQRRLNSLGGAAPFIQAREIIPAQTSGPVEIHRHAEGILIVNDGPNPVEQGVVEFELDI